MAKQKEHILTQAAKEIGQEIRGFRSLAADLFPAPTADAVDVSKQENLARYQRHWADPRWRVAELQRVGPEQFITNGSQAGVLPPNAWKELQNG